MMALRNNVWKLHGRPLQDRQPDVHQLQRWEDKRVHALDEAIRMTWGQLAREGLIRVI